MDEGRWRRRHFRRQFGRPGNDLPMHVADIGRPAGALPGTPQQNRCRTIRRLTAEKSQCRTPVAGASCPGQTFPQQWPASAAAASVLGGQNNRPRLDSRGERRSPVFPRRFRLDEIFPAHLFPDRRLFTKKPPQSMDWRRPVGGQVDPVSLAVGVTRQVGNSRSSRVRCSSSTPDAGRRSDSRALSLAGMPPSFSSLPRWPSTSMARRLILVGKKPGMSA